MKRSFLLVVLLSALAGCSGDSNGDPADPSGPNGPTLPVTPQAARGLVAFQQNCASCHASRDGYDLHFFRYGDTTIVRRALGHVDQATAQDIVAHIATFSFPQHPRDERPFQPGGVVLASDAAFGTSLFPNGFPTDLSTAQVRAMDPMNVRIAIALPRWSVEQQNTDWMPDHAVSATILADQNGEPQAALDAYHANPTQANLKRVMTALFSATHRAGAPGPCHFESSGRIDALECFQVSRWASTLVAQHMLRNGLSRTMSDTIFHSFWWEVAESVRRGTSVSALATNGVQNRVAWYYLGWMFGSDARPSLYMLPSFESAQMLHHATFVAIKSMVSRPANTDFAYSDLVNIPRYGSPDWLYGSLRFGYRHLLERIQAGDVPPSARLSTARNNVSASFNESSPRLTTAQRDDLRALSQAVLNALPN
jgi:hypothetical protein